MNSLVNISEGTSLAIHGLGLLADIAPDRINVKLAAVNLKASEAHLAKVFGKLQKSGLVSSTRGPSGGFTLEKAANQISFMDVYELFEAPVDPEACPMGRRHCPSGSCFFEGRIHKVSKEIYGIMKDTMISDMSDAVHRSGEKNK
jgi:Rrf2 family protein